jgi:predicted nucleic acid-binding protein
MDFLEHSLDGSLNILNLNPTDTLYSKDILYRFNDQDISFTDASSMAIMQRLGIIKVLSYDFHFSLLGFDLINPT